MAKYKLNDIAPIKQGVVLAEDKYWLLNLDMVESNTGKIIDYLYVPKEKIGVSTVTFDTDNVLYSKLRPYLNKVVLPDRPGYATSEMLPMRPNIDIITREYLTYFLRSPHFVSYINEKTSGAKMPRANSSDLKTVEIECPTINEQKRITAIFDEVISIIQLRQKELSKLDDLIKARFVEMFGTLHDNENGFEVVTLEDVCSLIKDGTHQTPQYTENKEEGFKFLSSKDVMSQKIDWTDIKYIPTELHEKLYATIKPQRNDILMSKNGVNYGVAAVNDTDEIFDIYVSLALLRPKKEIDPVFLRCVINNPETKRQFDSSIKGIGVPNLHLGEIRKTKIFLPPIELQKEFVLFAEQITKSKVAVQKALDETKSKLKE